jgi:hypothetical protein
MNGSGAYLRQPHRMDRTRLAGTRGRDREAPVAHCCLAHAAVVLGACRGFLEPAPRFEFG